MPGGGAAAWSRAGGYFRSFRVSPHAPDSQRRPRPAFRLPSFPRFSTVPVDAVRGYAIAANDFEDELLAIATLADDDADDDGDMDEYYHGEESSTFPSNHPDDGEEEDGGSIPRTANLRGIARAVFRAFSETVSNQEVEARRSPTRRPTILEPKTPPPTPPPTLGTAQIPTLPPGLPPPAVPGRPFVDAAGSPLTAVSITTSTVSLDGKSWSAVSSPRATVADSYATTSTLVVDNGTIAHNSALLGEEWTRNALGEHASVASFSAFSIALMTNRAPSELVRDALEAALDEVRHAKTSFDIASTLIGREIGPDALPASEHIFERDMKALALAVAREGCVDETLSSLEAAAEADIIARVLDDGAAGTKYSGVDGDVLAWIGRELRVIAREESNHAALAWRTIKWVCDTDSDACDAVKEQVLNKSELDKAFQHRFASFHGDDETIKTIKEDWAMIYSDEHDFDSQQESCADAVNA